MRTLRNVLDVNSAIISIRYRVAIVRRNKESLDSVHAKPFTPIWPNPAYFLTTRGFIHLYMLRNGLSIEADVFNANL